MPNSTSHDLTSVIGASLDAHHMVPLLEFVEATLCPSLYSASTVAEAKLALLKQTNMVDYAVEIYQKNGGKGEPSDLTEKRKVVLAKHKELTMGAKAFADIVGDSSKKSDLVQSNNWSVAGLKKASGISSESIEMYRSLAKYQYECGDYEGSYNMLENYLSLFIAQEKGTGASDAEYYSNNNNMSANTKNQPAYGLTNITSTLHGVLWGKLSCLILMGKWDEAMVALNAVKHSIDVRSGTERGLSALQSLKER